MLTREAAQKLGITVGRVCRLCQTGRLGAEKVGRDWHITPEALEKFVPRKAGRPKGARKEAENASCGQ